MSKRSRSAPAKSKRVRRRVVAVEQADDDVAADVADDADADADADNDTDVRPAPAQRLRIHSSHLSPAEVELSEDLLATDTVSFTVPVHVYHDLSYSNRAVTLGMIFERYWTCHKKKHFQVANNAQTTSWKQCITSIVQRT